MEWHMKKISVKCKRCGETEEHCMGHTGSLFDLIEKVLEDRGRAMCLKDPDKVWGECDVCGFVTVLDREMQMCGPCIWGESDKINGNW